MNKKGKYGEQRAVNFLIHNGYKIIARNYRFKKYEIDIICMKDNIVIICEVKYRTTIEYFNISTKQMQQLQNFILEKLNHVTVQIDAILVYQDNIIHIQNMIQ